ncbi:MAG: hypothetical protein J2P17_07755 [Mycobacterium sp.]|nr:hypothetical protein [Mycobacterium sp.]
MSAVSAHVVSKGEVIDVSAATILLKAVGRDVAEDRHPMERLAAEEISQLHVVPDQAVTPVLNHVDIPE